jgi:haloalkane dehalogenase
MRSRTFLKAFTLAAAMMSAIPAVAQNAITDGSKQISAAFPFTQQTLPVLGSEMAYVDTGSGQPVLFLHGNPTSSYLWRNIIPYVSGTHRAIAPDLIGMGNSAKPDIDYTYEDHARYLNTLIEQLELKDIILVVHDWGSVLGMEYARLNPDNVAGIVFMEALIPPVFPAEDLSSFGRLAPLLGGIRTPDVGEEMVLEGNAFLEQILLGPGVVRPLSDEEKTAYRAPFLTKASRQPQLQWPRELPIGDTQVETGEVITANGAWLTTSDIPKLYFYATPGALNPAPVVGYVTNTARNLETRLVGAGTHYIQEDHPDVIGQGIADWLRRHPAN